MTTIRDSFSFTYAGIHSSTFGIYNVNIEGGFLQENFLPSRSIVEDYSINRKEPYFYGYDYQPIEFTLDLAFGDSFTSETLQQVRKWLMQSYYAPLIFDDSPNVIFYAVVVGTPMISHNGANQGYMTVDFRCNSPYKYTQAQTITQTVTADNTSLVLTNSGNITIRPTISIVKSGAGGITIVNTSNNNKTTTVTGIANGETVTIDGEMELITVDSGASLYSNFNYTFLDLVEGTNNLTISGNGTYTFTYQGKLL